MQKKHDAKIILNSKMPKNKVYQEVFKIKQDIAHMKKLKKSVKQKGDKLSSLAAFVKKTKTNSKKSSKSSLNMGR
jgi:hypothetical protein